LSSETLAASVQRGDEVAEEVHLSRSKQKSQWLERKHARRIHAQDGSHTMPPPPPPPPDFFLPPSSSPASSSLGFFAFIFLSPAGLRDLPLRIAASKSFLASPELSTGSSSKPGSTSAEGAGILGGGGGGGGGAPPCKIDKRDSLGNEVHVLYGQHCVRRVRKEEVAEAVAAHLPTAEVEGAAGLLLHLRCYSSEQMVLMPVSPQGRRRRPREDQYRWMARWA
jgi:hypothetical protein